MNKKLIILIIVILIIIIGGYFLLQKNNQSAWPTTNRQLKQSGQTHELSESNEVQLRQNYEVIYTDDGYWPKNLTIKVGDIVTWKNESSQGMWTGSGIHPTHTVYSGTSLDEHCPDVQNTSFDQCTSAQPGESWSFTFSKKGTWRYHNHVQAANSGSIIVE